MLTTSLGSLRLAISFLFCATLSSAVAAPDYQDISKWQEVALPPKSDELSTKLFTDAANKSRDTWRVFAENGALRAKLDDNRGTEGIPIPPFYFDLPHYKLLTYHKIDDGWLIGIGYGEFGSDVFWYSPDGASHYNIAHVQIRQFFTLPDGVYAIEGLSHMGISTGSIIKFSSQSGRWHQTTVAKLPGNPNAIVVRRDGSLVLVLNDSIALMSTDHQLKLLGEIPWTGFGSVGTAVLSQDEQELYVGMRQFVGEFDMKTKKFRLLIPSPIFLNKLSHDEENALRQQAHPEIGQ